MKNSAAKCTERASSAATNTQTRPKKCFKVSGELIVSFGVFMSCKRVRLVLHIGSAGVYTGVYRARMAAIILPTQPHRNTIRCYSLLLLLLV